MSLIGLSRTDDDLSRFVGPGMLSACLSTTPGHSDVEELAERLGLKLVTAVPDGSDARGLLFLAPPPSTDADGEKARTIYELFTNKLTADTDSSTNDVRPATDISQVQPAILSGDERVSSDIGAASLLLLMKIVGAVAAMGYGFSEVRNVARLVAANFGMACSSGVGRGQEGGFLVEVEGQVKRMLLGLLGPDAEGGTVGMRVNSNEPVLMVNTSAMFPCGEMRGFLGQVISQLRVGYGVKPVRVYAGAHLLDRAFGSDEKEGKSFGLSILNVVNTEIGGASMVQLLDGDCEVSGWRVGVEKEQWEQCEGSVDALLELGMRNWEANMEIDRLVVGDGKQSGAAGEAIDVLEIAERVGGPEIVSDGKERSIQDAESRVDPSTVDQQHAEREPADAKEDEAAFGSDDHALDSHRPERLRGEEESQRQTEKPELSSVENNRAGTGKTEDFEEVETNIVDNETTEALNRDIGNSKDNTKIAGTDYISEHAAVSFLDDFVV